MPAIGLQSHIWNNNTRSLILLALYPLMITAIVWACMFVVASFGLSYNAPSYRAPVPEAFPAAMSYDPSRPMVTATAFIYEYWPAIMAVVAIWFLIAFFFHTAMIRKLSRSHPVTRKEEPALYNLLENLCIAQGVPMPRLEIIESHARNAFASGIDRKSFAITVTRGLMNSLTKDELEAVLAHELTHILNRDVRLLIITIIFTGMIGFAAQLVWSQVRYGFIYSGRRRERGGGILLMLALAAVLWIGYLATLFTRFAISRRREFMADAGAVQMTKNPEAMMTALMRIAGRDHIPQASADIAMMCIENAQPFLGMFATHPPIEARIKAIAETTGSEIPQVSLPPAPTERRFDQLRDPSQSNPWLTRQRRK